MYSTIGSVLMEVMVTGVIVSCSSVVVSSSVVLEWQENANTAKSKRYKQQFFIKINLSSPVVELVYYFQPADIILRNQIPGSKIIIQRKYKIS